MASATFNTQIVSSINNETLEYNLDQVITKDFLPVKKGYQYTIDGFVPDGVYIDVRGFDNLQTYLIIPPLVEFNLSILVDNYVGDTAIATTTVTIIEPNGTANFNTEILSSNSNDPNDFISYKLDDVITKDFSSLRGYFYYINPMVMVPQGVEIVEDISGSLYLLIPPKVEFELSVIVTNNDNLFPIIAIATTMVTIDKTLNFNTVKTEFYENSNYGQLKNLTIQSWSNIISQRISSGEESTVRPR